MKFKVCLLLSAFCIFSSSVASASSYYYEKQPSGMLVKSVKKPTSSIVRTTVKQAQDKTDYAKVISDLQKQVAENPDDFSLFVPLVEAYLNTNQYEIAYDDLNFLNSLKNNGRLSSNVINDINKLRLKMDARSKYLQNKSLSFVNIALLNLICDDFISAQKYMKKASFNVTNHKIYLDALKLIIDSSTDYENGILLANTYLINNEISTEQKLELAKLRVYFYTHLGLFEEALDEQVSILYSSNRDSETIYETYKLLVRNDISEDKVIKTLYPENSRNKEQCYYDLYKVLLENNNYEDAKIFADKLEKQYPDSLNTAFLKAETLLNEGHINQVVEILSTISDKLTRNEDITIYNRLMASVSKTPDKEALKLFNQGYPDKALELLEGKNIPQNANILAFKARCCMELNRMQDALDYLNRAISLDGDNIFVNLQFGNYYFANNDYELARKYAQRCLELDANNQFAAELIDKLNEIDASDYISQIISTYEAQNYEETARLLSEAIKIAPNAAILYYYQGLTNIAENNYAASTASLYKSLELDNTNIYAYYYLGIAFDNLAEYENAYGCYSQFLKLLPPDELGESEKIQYARTRINKLQNLL